MLTPKELWDEIKEHHEYSGHYSDVYIPLNDSTRQLINQYEFKGSVIMFRSQIDGKIWYDIPFLRMDEYIVQRRGKR